MKSTAVPAEANDKGTHVLSLILVVGVALLCLVSLSTMWRQATLDERLSKIEGLAAERGEKFRHMEKSLDDLIARERRP